MNDENNLYTIKEVSELVGISESEIIKLIMQKKIKAIRLEKAVRIKEKDIEGFLDSFTDSNQNERKVEDFIDESPTLYSAEQVAKILQLSVENIWNLLKNGKLRGFKIREGRSSWRITSESLNDFIKIRTKNAV